jgi:hypothetical protein
VTYTFEVNWSTREMVTSDVQDVLLDLEDDIVTNAVFVYSMDGSMGDEYTNTFVVYSDEIDGTTGRPIWTMETVKDHFGERDDEVLAEVDFNVRGATVRL